MNSVKKKQEYVGIKSKVNILWYVVIYNYKFKIDKYPIVAVDPRDAASVNNGTVLKLTARYVIDYKRLYFQ